MFRLLYAVDETGDDGDDDGDDGDDGDDDGGDGDDDGGDNDDDVGDGWWYGWYEGVQGTLHIQHSLRTKYSAFKFLMVMMVMMWRSNNIIIQRSTL